MKLMVLNNHSYKFLPSHLGQAQQIHHHIGMFCSNRYLISMRTGLLFRTLDQFNRHESDLSVTHCYPLVQIGPGVKARSNQYSRFGCRTLGHNWFIHLMTTSRYLQSSRNLISNTWMLIVRVHISYSDRFLYTHSASIWRLTCQVPFVTSYSNEREVRSGEKLSLTISSLTDVNWTRRSCSSATRPLDYKLDILFKNKILQRI